MHLQKCPRLARLAGSCCLLTALVVIVLATSLANSETNKQHEQQSARSANVTLRANNTSTRPSLATSKRQINNVNRGRPGSVASLATPSNNNQSAMRLISKYKLPSWFHFNTFKQLYGKRYPGGYVDELHKRIYLRTSLKVFEQRALYRSGRLDSLASVNELSDLTGEQLDQFRALRKNSSTTEPAAKQPIKGAQSSAPPSRQLPECCTYDQVYARVIGLLSAATNSSDSALSRALVDELEQKPLVESDTALDLVGAAGAAPLLLAGGGSNERPPLVKSTRREPQGENKASASHIDDKRQHKMIERRHRDDDDADDDADDERGSRELQSSKRAQLNNSTTSRHRKGGPDSQLQQQQRVVVVTQPAKSNLAPDHQTSGGSRLRHARPATSEAMAAAAAISPSSNRSTTSTGNGGTGPAAGNTQRLTGRQKPGAHSGPAGDEDERSTTADLGVPKEIEEAVRAQVAEQLSSSSALGRELSKQMSAYFGQPVEIRAVPASGSRQTAHKAAGQQTQTQTRKQQQQQQQSAPSTHAI